MRVTSTSEALTITIITVFVIIGISVLIVDGVEQECKTGLEIMEIKQ